MVNPFNINQKTKINGFFSQNKIVHFDDWIITTYIASLKSTQKIGVANKETDIWGLTEKVSLYKLKSEKNNKDYGFCISQKIVQSLPEEVRPVLISMGTMFAYLPNDLNNYHMRRLAQLEGTLSYTAAYIIRNLWSKKLCAFPKVDKRIKHILDADAEIWFRLYKLCIMCRDYLNNKDLQEIPRASDWLYLILQEYRSFYLKFIYSSEATNYVPCFKGADDLRAYAKALNESVNPCTEENEKYRYKLMEICMKIADISNSFRKELWRPYISSIRNKAWLIDQSIDILSVSNHKGSIKRHLKR